MIHKKPKFFGEFFEKVERREVWSVSHHPFFSEEIKKKIISFLISLKVSIGKPFEIKVPKYVMFEIINYFVSATLFPPSKEFEYLQKNLKEISNIHKRRLKEYEEIIEEKNKIIEEKNKIIDELLKKIEKPL